MVKIGYRLARGVASGGMKRGRIYSAIKEDTIKNAIDNDLLAVVAPNHNYALCIELGQHLIGFEAVLQNYSSSALSECKKYRESDKEVLSMLVSYLDENISQIAEECEAKVLDAEGEETTTVVMQMVTKDGRAKLDEIWQQLTER